MSDITRILHRISDGDQAAADLLLPLVYDELRKLAAARLACERPGQTLQATALVHEAYLRIAEHDRGPAWNGRGHFFAAAAEAMRRILVEQARRKGSIKQGGEFVRRELTDVADASSLDQEEILAVDEALTRLAATSPEAARLVELRYFAGLSMDDAAVAMGMSPRSAYSLWSYARSYLRRDLDAEPPFAPPETRKSAMD